MKIITINVPDKYINAIQDLLDLELYPNRSEILRIAIKRFLKKELEHELNLEQKNFIELMKNNQIELGSIEEPPKRAKKEKKVKEKRYTKHSYRPAQKPKTFLKVFPKDLYFNYIISHLYDTEEYIDYEKIGDLIGVNPSNACMILNKLKKKAPGLLISTIQTHPKAYRLDHRVLRKYMKEVNDN